jgi:hypothetical protein
LSVLEQSFGLQKGGEIFAFFMLKRIFVESCENFLKTVNFSPNFSQISWKNEVLLEI